jgi:tRNA threonylcarbamoyladenosine biosynthesis protein TsaE
MTEEKVYFAERVDDLKDVANKLLTAYPEARIFAFFGAMGVGKTTFIQAIARKLGVAEAASSPSYAIVNHYLTREGDSIYHFDFYRINKLEEVYDLGYEHYFFSGDYCFIEWPEKLDALLPENSVRVVMTLDGERRVIRF